MPAILIPFIMWLIEFLKKRSFGLAMVTVFVGLIAAYLAALAAVVGIIVAQAPPFVVEAMAVFLPSQWPLQFSTVAAIYSLGIAYRVSLQSVVMFSKS